MGRGRAGAYVASWGSTTIHFFCAGPGYLWRQSLTKWLSGETHLMIHACCPALIHFTPIGKA